MLIILEKEGPVHAFEFSPDGSEFCVIYGCKKLFF